MIDEKLTFSQFQGGYHAPAQIEFPDHATARFVIAVSAVGAAWGEVCDHIEARLNGEPTDRPYLEDAIGNCMVALAWLCNATATNMSMVATGTPEADMAAWQYQTAAWEAVDKTALPLALVKVGRQLGRSHGLILARMRYSDGLEYQMITPLMREVMFALRAVANVMQVDMVAACASVDARPAPVNGRG